jgi:SAM-dependent methyltransferase
MYVAIFGRQPAISVAELERVFDGKAITPLSEQAARVECNHFEITLMGSIPKAGKITAELPKSDWHKVSQKIVQHYSDAWSKFEGKLTLGISTYGFNINARDVQKTGIILKQRLKKLDVSLRIIPNPMPALNTAISHNNKLGLAPNKVELLVICANDGRVTIAESTGSQNITAYARRDQARPKRDTFVGMLPPKLAQIMLNLAVGNWNKGVSKETGRTINGNKTNDDSNRPIILDPFCGTGVILQEAALMNYRVYGTDLSEKMIRYSRDNLNWLIDNHHVQFDWYLHQGDAVNTKWQQPIDAVVSEAYLGQPFSAPPSSTKLEKVKQNCNHIITGFLKNLASQIKPDTPLCIAIPAWRDKDGRFTHLPLITKIARLGYKHHKFTNISQNDLLYCRESQIVARELLVLTKI